MNQQDARKTYHRPNLNWVCTAEHECGCPNGPQLDGKCASRKQCQPVLNDDRWECNRPANRGGICEKGPGPFGDCCFDNQGCVPQKSLRSKRKIFVVGCLALVTGFLLLGIWTPNRAEFLAPGGLSSSHAQIWSGPNSEDRCIACHSAGASGPVGWLVGLFGGGSHAYQPQYQKCLSCHKDLLPDDTALYAHNQPPELLAKVTSRVVRNQDRAKKGQLFATPMNHRGQIACANCHIEHHGMNHDLAALTDKQCQSCHANQFESFENGHPEFKNFSLANTSGISFDHYSHQAKYFAEAGTEFNCQSCHQGDAGQNTMTTVSFEAGCASCHEKKIDASLTQGLPIFVIPSLDVELLKANGLDIGQWPEDASGSFDGTLPPVMKTLLAGDEHATMAMKTLGPEFDLFELDTQDRKQLVAAYQLALSIKRLLYELSNNGQSGLIVRLENLASSRIPRTQLQQMVANLSAETFTKAQEEWFPRLSLEKESLLMPGRFVPDGSARAIVPRSLATTGRVMPATFVQSDEDAILAKNPISKFYQEKSADADSTDNDGLPATNKTIQFENLPQETKIQSREPSTPPQKIKGPTTASPAASTSKNVIEFHSGNRSEGARIVANPFFGGKQNQQESTSSFQSEQTNSSTAGSTGDAPNRSAEKREREVAQYRRKSQAENNAVDVADLPIVIDEQDFVDQEDEPDKLVENPIKKLIDAQIKARAGGNSPALVDNTAKENKNKRAEDPESKRTLDHKEETEDEKVNSHPQELANHPKSEKPNRIVPDDERDKKNLAADGSTKTPAIRSGSTTKAPKKLDPRDRVELGGWYRDDELLTVSYRQSGHADPLTRNWYDFVLSVRDKEHDDALSELRKMALNPTAAGQCGSCHKTVENDSHSLGIVWRSNNRRADRRGFTKFSHRPHLVQPGNNQCASCHQLNPEASILARSDSSGAVLNRQSGFHPITKSNCLSCHNEQSNVSSCTQCHNYHVDHLRSEDQIKRDADIILNQTSFTEPD